MRFNLYFLYPTAILFLSVLEINAQSIKGIVLDYETDSVVAFANVYFNASKQGTTTDQNGRFELNTKGYQGQDIIVSFVGYKTWIIEDVQNDKYYKIYLKPISHLLREIVVEADGMPYKEMLKLFKKVFLGTSLNASKCTIENIDDLFLTYSKLTKTLEAFCDKPLIIYNRALGYKITYFLDVFKVNEKHVFYMGNSLFEEDATLSAEDMKKVLKKREKTYYGSQMHFFRELWKGGSSKFKYSLQSKDTITIFGLENSETVENKNIKYLLPGNTIKITYRRNVSYIVFKGKNGVLFTEQGFYDPKYFSWVGNMGKQRIGDLLPLEYWP